MSSVCALLPYVHWGSNMYAHCLPFFSLVVPLDDKLHVWRPPTATELQSSTTQQEKNRSITVQIWMQILLPQFGKSLLKSWKPREAGMCVCSMMRIISCCRGNEPETCLFVLLSYISLTDWRQEDNTGWRLAQMWSGFPSCMQISNVKSLWRLLHSSLTSQLWSRDGS